MDAPPVQYVKTSDGLSIAYSTRGSGRSLLLLPVMFQDMHSVWQEEGERGDFARGLAARFALVLYDSRGTGQSTRGLPPGFSNEDLLLDIDSVVERLGIDRLVLVALAASVHTAVRYAAKHPDTVDALVLVAGSSTARPFPPALVQKLADEDWDGFLYLLARGDRSHEATLQAVAYYKRMVDRADYMVRTNEYVRSSVEDQLALLTVPTLVIHPREVHAPSYEDSAELASKIADSRLVVVGGGGPTTIGTMGGDPEATIAAIEAFLADLPPRPLQAKAPGTNSLSARELEVLRLLAQGKSNPEIAKQLFITRNTVQNHVSSILIKTNLTNRTEAAVYAKEHGLV